MTVSWRLRNSSADAVPKFVVWETPTSGDKMAPFVSPEDHFDAVYFSSTYDYYKIAHHGTHALTHAQVNALSTNMGSVVTFLGQVVATDQVLYTHGLGYTPRYMVAVGGQLIQNMHPVQIQSSDRVRTVAFYATATAIHCVDFGTSSSANLSSTTVTYELLLFRPPLDGVVDTLPMFSGKDGILGKGLIRATDILLRKADVLDASPFDLNLGPSVAVDNGCPKWFLSDGSTVTFGPYAGSVSAPTSIQCVVTE